MIATALGAVVAFSTHFLALVQARYIRSVITVRTLIVPIPFYKTEPPNPVLIMKTLTELSL